MEADMADKSFALAVATGLLASACALVPTGPSALPARGNESLAAYRAEDRVCRERAALRTTETSDFRDLQRSYDGVYGACMALTSGFVTDFGASELTTIV